MSDPAASSQPVSRSARTGEVLRRIPATITTVLIVVIVGVVGQGLWQPIVDQPWFDAVAYGLPALEAGRWWTPITGTFFVAHPLVYLVTLPSFAGMAFLEWRRGTRTAIGYFGIGQLFAVIASAAFLMGARLLPWPWAQQLAETLDVGPSGGTMACIAAAVGLLMAPWRQRAWVIVFAYAAIGLLFLGTVADLEHTFAILLVLAIDRSFRIQRTTIREQRLLAMTVLVALGAVQIVTFLIPTNGPFGHTDPLDGPWLDVAIDAAIVLLLARGLRLGRRWAWVVMVIWTSLSVLSGIALALLVQLADIEGSDIDLVGDVDVTIASSVLWLAFLVYLIATRRAFRVRRRRGLDGQNHRKDATPKLGPDDVRDIIRAHGGGTLSWMATWEGMRYYRTRTGIVPFQSHSGVAIALADPLGPAEGVAESVHEFAAAAEKQGLVPCFFSASAPTRDAIPEGWRSLVIADDTIVDLEDLAFTGKAWSQVRQALNRGDREELTFRLSRLVDEPWGVRQQIQAISESWVGDKGLPEMRFTLGTLQEAADPEVRIALALAPNGDVDGFLSWLPVYGTGGEVRGWTLDLMRRRDGGFGPVMEFLIGSSARAFADEGAAIVSLSGAPLAHESAGDEGVIARLLAGLGESLEPVYGFRSLHRFKTKFNPRYESIYLLYRDEGDLARIAPGLTRAFLPDATLRQFAAAGIDLIRRD